MTRRRARIKRLGVGPREFYVLDNHHKGFAASLKSRTYLLQIQLWKKHQDPNSEAPAHIISRTLALKICAVVAVKILSESAMQLNTTEPFNLIKDRFRDTRSRKPRKLPIRDWRECLLLTYPIRDLCSF